MKPFQLLAAFSVLAFATVALVVAQDKQAQLEMPPVKKATEHHKLLQRKVGDWNATVEFAGMPPTQATYSAKLDHGGMWLVGDYRGDFMGTPFSGHEVLGYATDKGKYVSTWIDSWIDDVMSFEGEYDEATKTLAMWTAGKDPATGKSIRERHDWTFVDADTLIFSMNHPGADGSYDAVMKITYRRKK